MAGLEMPNWHTKNTHGKNIKGLIRSFSYKESGDKFDQQMTGLSPIVQIRALQPMQVFFIVCKANIVLVRF